MLRGAALALTLVLPALALGAGAEAVEPWWRATSLDADRDGIDDALRLAAAPDAPRVLLLAYERAPTASQRAAVDAARVEVVAAYAHFDVLAVRATPADAPRLLGLPGVVFVEQDDAIDRLLKESVPLIGAPRVWQEQGATGKGIVVAVLDDGTFEQHPDLSPKIAGSFDAASSSRVGLFPAVTAAVPVVPAGLEGHGTHVAGTIVGPGTQSGGAYRGVAPDAAFVDVKVFSGPNQTSSHMVLRGLDWVLSNRDRLDIRVASMSLGGRASDGNDALSRAVNVAVDKGLVVVASAGNAGPAPGTIASPGAAEKAITVGAVDKAKRLAPYSSRGPLPDGRIKPDLVAPGTAITSTVPPGSTSALGGAGSGQPALFYGALSGTSMAAPHVSGVVALMLETNPELAPDDIKRILLATAQDLGAAGRDAESGYGLVDAVVATQVAQDPRLLESPRFASALGTLPQAEREDLLTRAEVELQRAIREGKLPLYGAAALVALAAIVVVARLARRR